MKLFLKRALYSGSISIILVATAYIYFFGGPFALVDCDIWKKGIDQLRAHQDVASTPKDAAFHYLYDGLDQPNLKKLKISVSNQSPDQSVVTLIDYDTQDDSVYVTYDRLTLRRDGSVWIPVRHQSAWQGRGRFGWTTQPTT